MNVTEVRKMIKHIRGYVDPNTFWIYVLVDPSRFRTPNPTLDLRFGGSPVIS